MNIYQFGDDDTVVKVYNPLEPDVSKKCIAVYENYLKAGNELRVLPIQVQKHCQSKTRMFAPRFNMEVACRLAAKEKNKIKYTTTTT